MGVLTYIIRWLLHLRSFFLRHCTVWLAATLLFCPPVPGHAETATGEYGLKTAFIYNFAKFVEWPDSAFRKKDEFCIASLGRSPIDRELAALSGKTVQGRSIVITQISTPEEANNCQVVFISRSELVRFDSILESLRNMPVLTIADRDDFCMNGGMLSLVNEGGKIVFDVNIKAVQRSRLKPNLQLLRLARKIYGRQ
jgi:hypothetical protein